MKNKKKTNNTPHKAKFKPGSKKRENKCIVTFDDNSRQEYLTGFHKRKVERRKAAVVEIQKKIKEEHIRVREERHKEYIRLLKERTDALDDDLEEGVTDTTESVQYDHPNHTVTVTTISNLDLTDAKLLGLDDTEVEIQDVGSNCVFCRCLSTKCVCPRIRSLSTSLNAATKQRKGKHKREGKGARGRPGDGRGSESKVKARPGKTSKKQRRQQTGKKQHYKD
uniref:Nucleolar protein 12 n=1 Tax=Gadus morhua TaxID=8049 RepID=A0A8C5B6M2_GADMO